MRSPAEIRFRVRQEMANAAMLLVAPRLREASPAPRGLPSVETALDRVRFTPFAAEVERLADCVMRGEYALMGFIVNTGQEIVWRRDAVHGRETPAVYFRRVPYLDFSRAGDHKVIWELNRHQHLVLLAQAFRLTGRRKYLDEIARQWESWHPQNPWLRGINWASALEVAFRALSWLWVDHMAGDSLRDEDRRTMLDSLYRHGCYLEYNLSRYFSPNTHLLGEAAALHALGAAYPAWPGAAEWRRLGAAVVEQQIERQILDDGSHFEQSSYYHVYAVDFFLFHLLMAGTAGEPVSGRYRERLGRAVDFLAALLGPARAIPLLGDDDGGRLFHPYGARDRFGRATMATAGAALGRAGLPYEQADLYEQAAWWLSEPEWQHLPLPAPASARSQFFPDAGLAFLGCGGRQAILDAGPLGPGSGGHSHADTLSFLLRDGDEEILVDSGTYTYVADPEWRNRFRGTMAHNTVCIDGMDQAVPDGPFRWIEKPEVALLQWSPEGLEARVAAQCRYRGFSHRRHTAFVRPSLWVVLDEVEGPAGPHLLEQFWHVAETPEVLSASCYRIAASARLVIAPGAEARVECGWRSTTLGEKREAHVVRASRRGPLPAVLIAVVDLDGHADTINVEEQPDCWSVYIDGEGLSPIRTITFPKRFE